MAVATMLLLQSAALVVLAFLVAARFLLNQRFHNPLYNQTYDGGPDIVLSVQALLRHLFNLLPDLPTWWYRIHRASITFLPLGPSGLCQGRFVRRFLPF